MKIRPWIMKIIVNPKTMVELLWMLVSTEYLSDVSIIIFIHFFPVLLKETIAKLPTNSESELHVFQSYYHHHIRNV